MEEQTSFDFDAAPEKQSPMAKRSAMIESIRRKRKEGEELSPEERKLFNELLKEEREDDNPRNYH